MNELTQLTLFHFIIQYIIIIYLWVCVLENEDIFGTKQQHFLDTFDWFSPSPSLPRIDTFGLNTGYEF